MSTAQIDSGDGECLVGPSVMLTAKVWIAGNPPCKSVKMEKKSYRVTSEREKVERAKAG